MDKIVFDVKDFEETAEILKVLSHPARLCIVRGLIENGKCNVNNMIKCINLPQSTVSQHISKLKSVGIIKGQRNGTEITYNICDEKVIKLIEIFFK